MASWAAILALTGFHYSAVTKTLTLASRLGRYPWSTGRAWGDVEIARTGADGRDLRVALTVHEGSVAIEWLVVGGRAPAATTRRQPLTAGDRLEHFITAAAGA